MINLIKTLLENEIDRTDNTFYKYKKRELKTMALNAIDACEFYENEIIFLKRIRLGYSTPHKKFVIALLKRFNIKYYMYGENDYDGYYQNVVCDTLELEKKILKRISYLKKKYNKDIKTYRVLISRPKNNYDYI